ncbi:MAG: FecR family protein [Bacteroidales bacterium]|nr:FecR family protein [Bacteroidales bacterium]
MGYKIPWNLFIKLFNGNISAQESRELENWRSETDLNSLLYEEITSDAETNKLLLNGSWDNNTHDWQKILRKINNPGKSISIARRAAVALSGLAASILLVLGIYTIMQVRQVSQLKNNPGFTHVFSPRGQRTSLLLPDNTKVWLNGESSLRYSANYNKTQREVYLDGEAFFEVSRDESRPFLVNTTEIKVKVYGTSFNIKAFPNEKFIETTLIKGKLSVTPIKKAGKPSHEIYLKPKEKCIYQKASGDISQEKIIEEPTDSKTKQEDFQKAEKILPEPRITIERNINAEQEELWKNGKLIFRNEAFEQLAVKIERWYDVKIHFEDENLKSYKFTGIFEKETINQAMEALRLSSKKSYKYSIVYRDIYLKKQ